MNKKFKDLQPGDKLYLLDPKPREIRKVKAINFASEPHKYMKHEIMEIEVKESYKHPKSENGQVWVVNCYAPLRMMEKIISKEALDTAKATGVENTEQKFYCPANASFCTAPRHMLVFSTSKSEIEQWMAKTK